MEANGLPKGWRRYPLRDPQVCVLNPPKREVKDQGDGTKVTFVPMAAVDAESGNIVGAETRELGKVRKGYTYFAENDVVFAKITPCMENGKAAIARGLVNGIGFGTTEFHVLRPGPRLISEWLHAFVRRADIRSVAKKNMHGAAGQQRVPVEFLEQLEIPVPPTREEQRRIVARIEQLFGRIEQLRSIAFEAATAASDALAGVYARLNGDEVVWWPLGDVADLVRRSVKIEPTQEYEEMGVRSFGNGTFKKPKLTGKQVGRKRIFWIAASDLVFNNVFAWEGAIAVAQNENERCVGSHRFITYVPKPKQAVSEFLCYHFLTPRGLGDIQAASPGSAGRNRTLGLAKLDRILVPMPNWTEQQRFAELVRRRDRLRTLAREIDRETRALRDALLAKAFRGEF